MIMIVVKVELNYTDKNVSKSHRLLAHIMF